MDKSIPQIRFPGFTEPWEQREFSSVVKKFDYGLNAPSKKFDGINQYLRITDIDDQTRKYQKTDLVSPDTNLDIADDYKLFEGDILFARTGASVGKSFIYNENDGLTYFAGYLIRAKIIDDFVPEFFFEQTLSDRYKKFVSTTSQRSGQPGINAKEYGSFPVWITSVEEQKVISTFFEKIDSLITLHQRKLNLLRHQKKGLLQKLFPQAGENEPELRFAGFTEPWEQRKLGDIGSTYSGLSGKTAKDFGHGNANFVTYLNVFKNPIADLEGTENIEIDNKQTQVLKGDVFFTTSSETPEEVGMSSIWMGNQPNTYLNSFCFGYRPTVDIDRNFLAYVLRSPAVRSKIIVLAQGISRYNISKKKMMEIKIPVPSIPEQKAVGNFFIKLDEMITLHQLKVESLSHLKKSLLDRMIV